MFNVQRLTRILFFSLNLLTLLNLLNVPAIAGSKAGTTGAAFLNLDVGARGIGMGTAHTAVTDDAASIYWNPAGLSRGIKKMSLSAMHSVYLADISYQFLSYAHRVNGKTTVAGAVYTVDYGSIVRTDITGNTLGSFNPKDMVYAASAAEEIDEFIDPDMALHMGFTAKYFSSKIIESAKGYAGDAGLILTSRHSLPYWIGVSVQNVGQGLQFDQKKDPLPSRIKMGIGLKFWERWIVAADAVALRESRFYGALGTEYNLTPNQPGAVFLRGGFNTLTEKDLEGYAGVHLGFGLQIKAFALDYAFAPFGELGSAHRFSLGMKW